MSSNTSNTDVVNVAITGVGGQGVLTLAEILAKAALADSHNVRVGEIHGMAQRGGHVVCTVRIGEGAKGPIIDPGTAHLVVGFEPVETVREAHLTAKDGYILVNSHIHYPVAVSMGKADYPSEDTIQKAFREFSERILEFDAMELATQAGSTRAMNMVMFGAIIGIGIVPINKETAIDVLRNAFPAKFSGVNIEAFNLGFNKIQEIKK
ncbi:MAG: indolepyruvate oxidoreductase subunit beta [Candidatus Thorarchaeota archaeon]